MGWIAVSERLHFKNPPIVEAILHLTVSRLEDSVLSSFAECRDEVAALGYRPPEEITTSNFKLSIEGGVSAVERTDARYGLKFVSIDGVRVSQFNLDGFVFSRLPR